MTSPAVRDEAARLIRAELDVRLTAAHDAVLRRVPDLYRKIIGEALLTEGGDTGKAAQLRVAQRALDRIARIGVVDFVDTAGRRWNMQSYVEMSVRTAAFRARVDAQMTVYRDRGITLVYVTNVAGQCELCRPWEGRVLAIDELPDDPTVIDGDGLEVEIAGTVAQAIAAGWGHPQCRHQLRAWQPGRTVIPPATPDPDAYAAQQRLRALESTLRQWRRREAAAMTPEAQALAARKVEGWQAEIRRHVADTGVRRQTGRERIDQALPNATPTARPARSPEPTEPSRPQYTAEQIAALTDDELDVAMAEAVAAEDLDLFGILGDESDRREEEREAATAAREVREARNTRARELRAERAARREEAQAARMEQLIADGWSDEQAAAEAYGTTVERLRRDEARARLIGNGYVGSWQQMTRAAFRDTVREEYQRAEDALGTSLLTNEAKRAGISDASLFVGNEARARRWASDELKAWWDVNGRLTYDQFVDGVVNGGARGDARGGDFLA